MRRVAVNRLSNSSRSLRRRQRAVARLVPPIEGELSLAAVDVRDALARLAPRQCLAVSLFYLADLSTAEVAAAMDISEGTVKSTLSEARERLRTILEVIE